MNQLRVTLLALAALLMLFGAIGYAVVLLPDLHGDLVELGVRPTVLGATVLHLYFAAAAMFAFVIIVSAAAIKAFRGRQFERMPLAIIAVIHSVFGLVAFSRSYNPHHLGAVLMGVLLAAALVVPDSTKKAER